MLLYDDKEPFAPFRDDPPTIPVSLRAKITIFSQLTKDLIPGTHCSIKNVYRVNSKRQKIKQVLNTVDISQTPERLVGFKRGHLSSDYLLLIPESVKM